MADKASKDLKSLLDFKSRMEHELKDYCIKTYGEKFYNRFIMYPVSDMLENLEFEMEILADKTVREDSIDYDGDKEDGLQQDTSI